MALIFACRGTCNRLRTATVIRNPDKIFISGGYNGAISRDPHCDDTEHLIVDGHCIRTNHGEENALLNCLDLSQIKNGTATMIGNPCFPCARKLIGKGIKKLRYIGSYSNALSADKVIELCKRQDVEFEFVELRDVLETIRKAINFLQGPGGPFKDWPEIKLEISTLPS